MLVNLTDLQSGRSLDLLPIGQPIPIMSYMYSSNVSEILTPGKFIELTKDLTGTGLFNENKLISQLATTVGAGNSERYYTAIIDDSDSPLNSEVVVLMNSSEIQLSDTSWINIPTTLSSYNGSDTYRYGRMQGHRHQMKSSNSNGDSSLASNAFAFDAVSYNIYKSAGIAMVNMNVGNVQEAITDNINGTTRTGSSTEQSSIVCKMFMRIK